MVCLLPQEGFMACAQQYAQVTDLSRRVAEWEQKIIPKLEEEVSRAGREMIIIVGQAFHMI